MVEIGKLIDLDDYDDPDPLEPSASDQQEKVVVENGHFSRLPAAAVFDRRLSAANLRWLAALGVYADRNGFCWPSMTTLARRMGCTRQNVSYHIRKVEGFGYVHVTRRKRGNGANDVNLYQLVYPPIGERPKPLEVANPALTIEQVLALRGGKP
jgi:DNA-binding transcriptional ArsR family regulator